MIGNAYYYCSQIFNTGEKVPLLDDQSFGPTVFISCVAQQQQQGLLLQETRIYLYSAQS